MAHISQKVGRRDFVLGAEWLKKRIFVCEIVSYGEKFSIKSIILYICNAVWAYANGKMNEKLKIH